MTVAELLARAGTSVFLMGLVWAAGGLFAGRADVWFAALAASSLGFLVASVASGFTDDKQTGDAEEDLTEWDGVQ